MSRHLTSYKLTVPNFRWIALFLLPVAAATPLRAGTLTASGAATPGSFGYVLSADGSNVIVTDRTETALAEGQGAAYFYSGVDPDTTSTTQTLKVLPTDSATNELFGNSVALSGDNAVIGTSAGNYPYSEAYYCKGLTSYGSYYSSTLGAYTETLILGATDQTASDYFGYSVAISGDSACVTRLYDATNGSNAGAVYYFNGIDSYTSASGNYNSTTKAYTEAMKLVSSNGASEDKFGRGLAMSGDNVLIGADIHTTNGSSSGEAYYFHNVSTYTTGSSNYNSTKKACTETLKLVASDIAVGYSFGGILCLDGDNALVSAPRNSTQATYAGAVYYFKGISTFTTSGSNYNSTYDAYTENAKLIASDATAYTYLGARPCLSGSNALIGAYCANLSTGSMPGALYYYEGIDGYTTSSANYNSTYNGYTETLKITASSASHSYFGGAAALVGDAFYAGSPKELKVYTGRISTMTTLDVSGGDTRTIDGLNVTTHRNWIIGSTYSDNAVTIASGASVAVSSGYAAYIGKSANSDNSMLDVAGTFSGTVYVGSYAGNSGNKLAVGSSATLTSATVYVAPGNKLAVSGDYSSDMASLIAKFAALYIYTDLKGTATQLTSSNYSTLGTLVYDSATGLTTFTANTVASAPTVSTVTAASGTEGDSFVHTVTLSAATTASATYALTLVGDSTDGDAATIGTDTCAVTALTFSEGVSYDSTSGNITVPSGVTSFTVTVATVGDTTKENTEYYTLTVGGVSAVGTLYDLKGYTADNPFIINASNAASYRTMSKSTGTQYYYYEIDTDADFGGDVILGDTAGYDWLSVYNSSVSMTSLTIGNQSGCYGTLNMRGSIVKVSGDVSVGPTGTGYINVRMGSLLMVDGSITSTTGRVLLFGGNAEESGGFIAIKGKLTIDQIVANLALKVEPMHEDTDVVAPVSGVAVSDRSLTGVAYYTASASNTLVIYLDGTVNKYADTFLHGVFGDKVDLNGYTVVCYSPLDLTWSGFSYNYDYWFGGSWYGTFYYKPSYGQNFWSQKQGWQYGYNTNTSAASWFWDYATSSWWYSDTNSFPWMYHLTYDTSATAWGGNWYRYDSGSGSDKNREFYGWTEGEDVGEGSIPAPGY